MISSENLPNNLSIWRYKRTEKSYTETLAEGVTLTLMLIPAGEFWMGAPEDEPESRENERSQRLVQVQQFLMGRYPVTQAQWRAVAGYEPCEQELNPDPSRFKGDNRPVECVSWNDAKEFCQRLSRKSGKGFRLPSEAEWEYACRARTTTPFHFGATLWPDLANCGMWEQYNGSPIQTGLGILETTDVGRYPANDWGLYDMHGNVQEWCEDYSQNDDEDDPSESKPWVVLNRNKTFRVVRGGSWGRRLSDCRSSFSNGFVQESRSESIGFRVICVPPKNFSNP